jgi:ribosomal protein L24E
MICENCEINHNGSYGSGRFCNAKCARGFATKNKRADINYKVSEKMTNRKLTEEHIKNIEQSNNFNRKEKTKRNCLECSDTMLCRPSDNRKFCSSKCWANYTEKNKEPFLLYRQRCNFDFRVEDYPDKFDLTLLEQNGWYSPSNKGNNLNGVSKDHMISVRTGFDLGIDPEIIKHPANCELLLHRQNQSKREKSSISLSDLLERINKWSV